MRPSQEFGGTGEQGQLFQGNKGLKIRGTGEQRQFWRMGNIENQDFVFGEQGKRGSFSWGTGEQAPPPGRASEAQVVHLINNRICHRFY